MSGSAPGPPQRRHVARPPPRGPSAATPPQSRPAAGDAATRVAADPPPTRSACSPASPAHGAYGAKNATSSSAVWGPRVPAPLKPPHEFQVPDVPARQLVEAPLAGQGQHLERPVADAADRAEPAPPALVVAVVQVDAAARDLAGGANQRDRAPGQIHRLEQRRRREHRGGRDHAYRLAGTGAQLADEPGAHCRGPRKLDQLLADRPGERLERVGLPPTRRPGADRTDRPISGSKRKRS